MTTADVPAQPNAPTLAILDPDNAPLNISVTFANPSDGGSLINSWFIERWDATTTNWSTIVASTGTTDLVYPDNSVVANTEYKFRVSAINGIGTSVVSSESTAITTPNVPDVSTVTLAINDPNASPLVITVTPVAGATGGSAILDYNLEYSSDGTTWNPLTTGLTGTYDHTVSSAGTHYYQSQARNNVGTGVFGASSNIDTPTVPDAPTVTLAILDPNNSPLEVTATFVPAGNGGSNIIDYNLHHSTDDILYTQVATGVTGTSAYTVSASGTHYFKAEARNNVGLSSIGVSANIATPTVPTPPQSLTATTIDNTNIELNWNMPSSTGGSVLQSFSIQNDATGTFAQVATVAETATTYTHQNLNDATNYNYQVVAINNVGSSNPSNQADAWTKPNAPVGLTANTISSNNSLELTWTMPTGTVTDFRVERALFGTSNWSTSQSPTFATACSGASCVITETGLASGSQHQFRIYASNLGGESTVSTSVNNWTVPDAPTGLTASTLPNSSDTANLSWSAPSGTVVSYQIERESPIGGGWSIIVADTGSVLTQYDDSPLALSTEFNYRVSGINLGGVSTSSIADSITTLSVPSAPASLTLTLQDPLKIQLDWGTSGNLYSGTLQGYKIERQINNNGWTTAIENTASTSTTAVDGGLIQGVQYEYRVSAITQIGTSNPSSVATGLFAVGTFSMTVTPIGGNTVQITPAMEIVSAVPNASVTKIWLYTGDPSYSAPVAQYPQSVTLTNGNPHSFATVFEYPTAPTTYTARAWVTQGDSTTMFTSADYLVTPLTPFSDNIMGLEQRNNGTSGANNAYTMSQFEFMAQPAGYDLVLKYQHIDPTNEPKFYAYENVQTSVNSTVTNLEYNNDYYISAYLNPTAFDYNVVDPATNEVQIVCNEDSPSTCPDGTIADDVPKGVPSEFVIRSHKAPTSQTQLGIEPMGDLFGIPMIFLFVIGLGAIFTGRNAQMGILIMAVTIGVMTALGYIDFNNPATDIDENIAVWGIMVVITVLGMFIGKRF